MSDLNLMTLAERRSGNTIGEERTKWLKILEGGYSLFRDAKTILGKTVEEIDTGKEYKDFFIDFITVIDSEINELMNVKEKITDDKVK